MPALIKQSVSFIVRTTKGNLHKRVRSRNHKKPVSMITLVIADTGFLFGYNCV